MLAGYHQKKSPPFSSNLLKLLTKHFFLQMTYSMILKALKIIQNGKSDLNQVVLIFFYLMHLVWSSHQEIFCKKMVLKILQILPRNTCARVSFFKKRFPVNFAKFS